ncbi:hypothetical protein ETD83_23690 [Actinomadura soli]|uniref:DUF485 domain-containing protein n=1 Tax=Actinomadura soli TaxID=2508997 RepID=A0A5C4J7S0_9ACTN|nr:hypothetical protein [Actinomadura soli]TMQ94569.1 hypothetical protein ETD83_23690 [Actinomadura soli]
MNGERRVAVTGTATVRARTIRDDADPPSGTRPAERPAAEPSGSDQPDPDPLHTGSPVPDPRQGEPPDTSRSMAVGAAAATALIRLQLGIALRTCAIVIAVVAGLPALLALAPGVAHAGVRGVPLFWPVLVFGVQPVWIAVALRQLRRAERAERELTAPAPGRGTAARTPRREPVGRP